MACFDDFIFVQGEQHAARRQIRLHRQTETPGPAHREGYRKQGVSEGEAETRAWATVNKTDGGGKKSGAGKKKSSTT
jgi:hypothetical protein